MQSSPTTDAPAHASLLQDFLSQRDIPCPGCRYNLRGLTTAQCPECGENLRLTVGLEYPKQAALITGLVGLAASAGFNAMLLVYLILEVVAGRGMNAYMYPFLFINLIGMVISGGLIAAWLLLWRRLHRQDSAVRWMASLVCLALPLINAIAFYYVMR